MEEYWDGVGKWGGASMGGLVKGFSLSIGKKVSTGSVELESLAVGGGDGRDKRKHGINGDCGDIQDSNVLQEKKMVEFNYLWHGAQGYALWDL